jgi:hypothetical protein
MIEETYEIGESITLLFTVTGFYVRRSHRRCWNCPSAERGRDDQGRRTMQRPFRSPCNPRWESWHLLDGDRLRPATPGFFMMGITLNDRQHERELLEIVSSTINKLGIVRSNREARRLSRSSLSTRSVASGRALLYAAPNCRSHAVNRTDRSSVRSPAKAPAAGFAEDSPRR